MKRVLGTVLFGIGVAAAVFAAGLRFSVAPLATNIPYDLEPSTTIAEARNAVYLGVSARGPAVETGTLRSYTFVVPQPGLTRDELTGDLAGSAVVWDVYSQITDTSSGTVVTASSQQIALDRKSGAYAPWEGTWVDNGDGEEPATFTGHSYKLPFYAEQKAYPFWDDQLGEAVDIEFVGVEEVSGLEAYKYEHTIEDTRISYDPDTLALLREALGNGSGDIYYSTTRTIWVEPVTGQFLNVREQPKLEFRPGSGNPVTLLAGDFSYTEQTKAEAAATIANNRDQLMLVNSTLPLAAGAGGLVLIIIGVVLIATSRPSQSSDEPAPEMAEAYTY